MGRFRYYSKNNPDKGKGGYTVQNGKSLRNVTYSPRVNHAKRKLYVGIKKNILIAMGGPRR